MSKHNPPSGSAGQNKGEDQPRDNHRRVSGKVDIAGAIEAHLPKRLIDEYETSTSKTEKRESRRFVVEFITLLCVFAVGIMSFIQMKQVINSARIAQASYDATTRPYLGIDGTPIKSDAFGNPAGFSVVLKNDGSTPAYKVRFDMKMDLIGASVHATNLDHGELMILPTAHIDTEATLSPEAGQKLQTKQATISIYLRFSYHWRDKYEEECEKETYVPELKTFLSQGNNCPKWETIGKNNVLQ